MRLDRYHPACFDQQVARNRGVLGHHARLDAGVREARRVARANRRSSWHAPVTAGRRRECGSRRRG
ncbi:hypothetical protein AZ78_4974 [Lysobacter capsici AZ78]|uniref:Uncharacterized protein n=1 Tax=Lysobacter capsici AZ78 TaxID=1444315 RepID=A0A108U4B6_9GAMM|nr:hypothetical protein AZ78_4974 [Lysobacter capsici AZ78]